MTLLPLRLLRQLPWLCLIAGVFRVVTATAAESLATYAPAESALFVEVPTLDATWRAFDESALAARWQTTRLSDLWLKSRFVERWRNLDEFARGKTGETLTHHLRRLFGDGVAVAVVLREGNPTGILLSQAATPEDVLDALRAWDQLEPPLKMESRTHAGRAYQVRVIRKSGQEQRIYYAVDGPRFLLSDHETLLRDCLERWPAAGTTSATPRPSLATTPEYAELQSLPAPSVSVFVAPQRWLPVLKSLSDDKPASQLLLAGISQLHGLVAAAVPADGVTLMVSASLRPESLTTGWRDFVASAASRPSIIESTPDDALLVIGSRFDPRPMIRTLPQLMTDSERKDLQQLGSVLKTLLLGVDPWDAALPALLSDWGAYLVLRPLTDQMPPRNHPFVAVGQAQWPAAARDPAIRTGLDNALTFGINAWATALMMQPNQSPIVLQHLTDGDAQDWRIAGRAWGDVALRSTPTHVLLSTSIAELDRPRTGEPTTLTALSQRHFPDAAAFAWLNARHYRTSLAPAVLQLIADFKEPPPLAVLNELGQLFDDVFAAVTVSETRLGVQLGGRLRPTP